MNIKNCKLCGRIFNYISGPSICPGCKKSQEAKFQEVKEYIREHRGVGVNEVAEACDVEASQIRQWLREDRLEVTEDSALFLSCESCGAPIRSGRFCEKCKNSMAKGFSDAVRASKPEMTKQKPSKEDGSPKMRFLQ